MIFKYPEKFSHRVKNLQSVTYPKNQIPPQILHLDINFLIHYYYQRRNVGEEFRPQPTFQEELKPSKTSVS